MTHVVDLTYESYPWDDAAGATLQANDDLSTPVLAPVAKGSSGALSLPGIGFRYRIDYDGAAAATLHYEAFQYVAGGGAPSSAQIQLSATDDLSVPVLVDVAPGDSGTVVLGGIGFNLGGGPAFDVQATVIEQLLPNFDLTYDGAAGTVATFRGATKLPPPPPAGPEQGYFARWFDHIGNPLVDVGVGDGIEGPDGVVSGDVPLAPGLVFFGSIVQRVWNGSGYDDSFLTIQPLVSAFTQGAAGEWVTPTPPIPPLEQVVLDAPQTLGVERPTTFQALLLGADLSLRAEQEFVFGVPSGEA